MKKLDNLEKFLNKHGFKSISYSNFSVNIVFIDSSDALFAQNEYKRLHIQADKTQDVSLQSKIYKEGWQIYNKAQKEFLPKLLPIVDALNEFYLNRSSSYKNLIFLSFIAFDEILISSNKELASLNKNNPTYFFEIEKEFDDFDSFLKNY